MVPVNLRNYFPSYSMTNFFGWIEAGQVFEENTRFEEVLQNLQHVFRTELVKERIADNMNRLVRLEKNPLLRAVPLEIKNLFLLAGTTLLLLQHMRPSRRKLLRLFIFLIVFLFAVFVLIVGGAWLVYTRFHLGVTSASLEINLGYVYLALPLGGLLTAYYAVDNAIALFRSSNS